MAEATMKSRSRQSHDLFLRAPSYCDAKSLAAGVAETVTTLAGAMYVRFSGNLDFYATYILDGESEDLVTNGTFTTDTGWTKGTGWTIAAGVATSDASQAGDSDLEQAGSALEGKAYLCTFTVSGYSAGNVTMAVGGTEGTDRSANGTYSETIIAGSDGKVLIRADLDFAGSVDNFSVAPIAAVPGDVATGEASELNPDYRYIPYVDKISLVAPANTVVTLMYYTR